MEFTAPYGIGLADVDDDDSDLVYFYVTGSDNEYEGVLTRRGFAATAPVPIEGITVDQEFHELKVSISEDRSTVEAYFDGVLIFHEPLIPLEIPLTGKVKIGNPGGDICTGQGLLRQNDIKYDDLLVIQKKISWAIEESFEMESGWGKCEELVDLGFCFEDDPENPAIEESCYAGEVGGSHSF